MDRLLWFFIFRYKATNELLYNHNLLKGEIEGKDCTNIL